jgi:hypothetical protein
MVTRRFASATEGRKHLPRVLDAAPRGSGLVTTVTRDQETFVVISADTRGEELRRLLPARAVVITEGGGWAAFLPTPRSQRRPQSRPPRREWRGDQSARPQRFCLTEGSDQLRNTFGGTVGHHITYELRLPEGRVLRTRVSRPADHTTYGPPLWRHVLADQLDVTEAEIRGVRPRQARA